MISIIDATFDEQVLKSDKVVLCDFSAEWCFPCRMMRPLLERLEEEYADRVVFGTVDADTEYQNMNALHIVAIPSIFIYKGGEVKRKFFGVVQEEDIRLAIDDLLR